MAGVAGELQAVKHGITLFLFRSDTAPALHAYSGSRAGHRLPPKLGPWSYVSLVGPGQSPERGLRRVDIETGIAKAGYQMWRRKVKADGIKAGQP